MNMIHLFDEDKYIDRWVVLEPDPEALAKEKAKEKAKEGDNRGEVRLSLKLDVRHAWMGQDCAMLLLVNILIAPVFILFVFSVYLVGRQKENGALPHGLLQHLCELCNGGKRKQFGRNPRKNVDRPGSAQQCCVHFSADI